MYRSNIKHLQNGKYRIIRVLGQGGFGITYLAEHTMLDKEVAIKEFFPKEFCDRQEETSQVTIGTKNSIDIVDTLKTKFIKEAKNISKLNHPNIITIYDIFQENNTAYYVMEYVDGLPLSDFVRQNGPLNEAIALKYIRKIAHALRYMHSMSMNHLDIKPANIMIRKVDDEPVLIDFGLSKQYDASGGQTSTTPVGISHGYAPAEQYRPGGVSTFSPQTDIYALGATLFFMLSGNIPPHYSEIIEDGIPNLPPEVSQQTFNAIEKAMEIKKSRRPASTDDFLSLLPSPSKLIEAPTVKESIASEPENVEIVEQTLPTTNDIPKDSPDNEHEYQLLASTDTTVLLFSEEEKVSVNPEQISATSDDKVEYIDLGLSVKWANKIIAPDNNNNYLITDKENRDTEHISTLNTLSQLPTINNYEELLEKCDWVLFSNEEGKGYKITGPNGNSLNIELSDINNYLLKESLEPDALGYIYLFHLDKSGAHLYKTKPIEANIWTVKV